jgi:apolipoprotein N-acyltransferase
MAKPETAGPDLGALRVAGSSAAALPRLADRIGHLQGWRRAGVALLLGLIAAPAMPPFNIVPLLLIGFTGLVWLLDGAPGWRRAWCDGWLWGMGFLVPNLYWVAYSMTVDLAHFWWMIPVSALGLPAGMSLFPAFGTGLYRFLRPRGLIRIGLFAICWALSEWLRGHVPWGGFPWVLIGYTWSSDMPVALDVLQSTSLFGIYGLSFFTALLAALPARLGDPSLPGQGKLRLYTAPAAGAALLLLAIFWGADRLANGVTGDVPGVTLRIVQTDVANRDDGGDAPDHLSHTLAEADRSGADAVTAQIWPESTIDYLLNQEPELLAEIAKRAPPDGLVLTGATLGYRDTSGPYYYNSLAAVTPQGRILASYAKAHLVPFGEYIPMRWLLDFIPAVAGRGGLATGPGPVTLHLPGLPPVAPIICYEAVFPHAVIDESDRPAWLLNDTNDSWFGRSIGPYQHFALARVRTVEEGLPLIRAANGGISGVVDAYGRRVMTLPLGEESALDVKLPNALPTDTLYGKLGDSPLLLIVCIALVASISLFWRRGFSRY